MKRGLLALGLVFTCSATCAVTDEVTRDSLSLSGEVATVGQSLGSELRRGIDGFRGLPRSVVGSTVLQPPVGPLKGAVGQFKRLAREVRIRTSSKLEGRLLRATRPDGGAVKEKHVEWLLQARKGVTLWGRNYEGSEPTKVMVAKIWRMVTVGDWETSAKALFLLHQMLRDSTSAGTEQSIATEFRRHAGKMAVTGDRLQPQPDLFSGSPPSDFCDLVERYAAYLLFRTSECNEDLLGTFAGVTATTPLRRRLASTLSSANRLMALGLRCHRPELVEVPVINQCMRSILQDLCERAEALRRDDISCVEGLTEDSGDLIGEVLHAEVLSHKPLLQQLEELLQVYGVAEGQQALQLPTWMNDVLEKTQAGAGAVVEEGDTEQMAEDRVVSGQEMSVGGKEVSAETTKVSTAVTEDDLMGVGQAAAAVLARGPDEVEAHNV